MTRLGVVYGYPLRYATSIETAGLVRHLGVDVVSCLPREHPDKRIENLGRLRANLVDPFRPGFACDLLLYGNDGIADVALLKRVRRVPAVLVWYDAYRDYVSDPPPRRRVVDRMRYRNVREADLVLGVSDLLVDMARRLQGREDGAVYMPTGVDTTLFDPARHDGAAARRRLGLPESSIVVGYLGRVGLPRTATFAGQPLLEASPLVRADVRYLVVAWGERMPEFRDFAGRLPTRDRFVFAPFVPHGEVPSYLAACDVLVDTLDDLFLSRARNETKMKEYLAMGRPIVATAVGENLKDLDDGRAGILVPPGDPAAIARAIDELASAPERRRELGRRARARALERYDWRVVAGGVRRALESRGLVDPV